MTTAELLARAYAIGASVARHRHRFHYSVPAGPHGELLVALLREREAELFEILPDAARRFSAEEETLFRFARMRRQAGAEIPPRELLARLDLSCVPDRCRSCGELLELSAAGEHCPACEAAASIVRQLHQEGRLWPTRSAEAAA